LVGKKHLYKRADINKFLVKEGDMDIWNVIIPWNIDREGAPGYFPGMYHCKV
jgi:hypothetical protein